MSSSDGAVAAKPADFMARRLVAGAGAGIITKTCIAPLERAKILLQIQAMRGDPVRKYRGTVGTMRTVFVEEGVLGLWKGNFANVLRVMPVYALKFSFNDTFKSMVAGKSTEKLTFTQLMMSGTLAGLFQQLVTYPLETVRTRLSVGEGLGLKYRSIWECGKDLVQKEGALAFYKGVVPTILSGAPYVGMQMSFYEIVKRHTPTPESGPQWVLATLFPGTLAGVVAQTITYPGDTVRRRLQTDGAGGRAAQYRGTWHCCTDIMAKEGVAGFFQGVGTNIIRCIPGAGIQFLAYEVFCSLLDAN